MLIPTTTIDETFALFVFKSEASRAVLPYNTTWSFGQVSRPTELTPILTRTAKLVT